MGGAEQDFGAQAVERLQHEAEGGVIHEGFILELGVDSADDYLRTGDDMGEHGDEGFPELVLGADAAGEGER